MTKEKEQNENESVGWREEMAFRKLPDGNDFKTYGVESFLKAVHYIGQNIKDDNWAYHFMKEAAECGNCNGHIWIARMYRDGSHGAGRCELSAKRHYKLAEEQGSQVAKKELGELLEKIQSDNKTRPNSIDYSHDGCSITVEWESDSGEWKPDWPDTRARPSRFESLIRDYLDSTYELSAKDAFLTAMDLLKKGKGNNKTAILPLLRKSANSGYLEAQNWLACIYRDGGYGAVQSEKKAIKYFKRAAKQGSDFAKRQLKVIKKKGLLAGING